MRLVGGWRLAPGSDLACHAACLDFCMGPMPGGMYFRHSEPINMTLDPSGLVGPAEHIVLPRPFRVLKNGPTDIDFLFMGSLCRDSKVQDGKGDDE